MHRLVYFSVPGRAEASRIALSLSGIEWEDVEVNGEEFSQLKKEGKLPWGMLPILQTSKGTIAESSAILRYAGKIAGLIPDDSFQAAKADEFIDGMGPIARAMDTTFGIQDDHERIRLRKQLFEPDGAATKALKLYDKKIKDSKSGWAADTDEMSIADLKLFTELFAFFSGNYDGIEKSMLMDYKNLLNYHHKVANEERIKNHYRGITSEDIRWTFLPNAFE
jgi:Glutathione S-transferase|tara:strand:- start:754 stop:1419 length:666 start_codon:yes stop_codon:yes gene_type:complete